mmetsp:Transcript_71285/g.128312  ORF Transcript_71285/g.128312 Transcript_71285/m.128312 type:complete len:374 (+) Transcript_71285:50-1171(+)
MARKVEPLAVLGYKAKQVDSRPRSAVEQGAAKLVAAGEQGLVAWRRNAVPVPSSDTSKHRTPDAAPVTAAAAAAAAAAVAAMRNARPQRPGRLSAPAASGWDSRCTPGAGPSAIRYPTQVRRPAVAPPRGGNGQVQSAMSNAAAGACVTAEMYNAAARATSVEARPSERQPTRPPVQRPGSVGRPPLGNGNGRAAGRMPGIPGSGAAGFQPVPSAPPLSARGARPGSGQQARQRPSIAEQRRVCDRLSKGRCGDPRHTALMRRLNESASWLSEVSGISDDDDDDDGEESRQSGDESRTQEEPVRRPLPHGGPDARNLCIGEYMHESVTWLDTELDVEESSEEEIVTPPRGGGPDTFRNDPEGFRAGIDRAYSI